MVCRDLLSVSSTAYGSKINDIRESLNKKLPFKLFIWILRILKPDRAEHLDTSGR